MSKLDKMRQQASVGSYQNRVKRVVNSEKKYNKPKRSKSDVAYINGDVRKSASMKAYGVKQAKREGKTVYGYEDDDVFTGGRKASNYKKLKQGLNPYEALYVTRPGAREYVPGGKRADGSTYQGFMSKTRRLTDLEKEGYRRTGRLDHPNYQPKEDYIKWDERVSGGKFQDRLKTGRLDGLEIAKRNQRSGKPLQNAWEYIKGGAKDFIGDPLVDALKIGGYGASVATGVGAGLMEQSGNIMRGISSGGKQKYWEKDRIKKNVKDTIKELDETGWGKGFGDYLKEGEERAYQNDLDYFKRTKNNYMVEQMLKDREEQKKKVDIGANIAGFGMDIVQPTIISDKVGKGLGRVGKKLSKDAKDILKGNAKVAYGVVPEEVSEAMSKYRKPSKVRKGASDDVFFAGKKYESNTPLSKSDERLIQEVKRMDNDYARNVAKEPRIKTGRPALDNTLRYFDGFKNKIDDIGEQRRIDGRKLNKKRTQTIDGYVPNKLDDVMEDIQKGYNTTDDQISFFGNSKLNDIGLPKQQTVKPRDLNLFKDRLQSFKEINPIYLKEVGDEGKFLMNDILRYKPFLSKADKKGGLANTKVMKLPKGKQEEFVNAINDLFFEGKPVVDKNIKYGYLREFAEKFGKQTPEEFYNVTLPRLAESLTDPTHYQKGQYLKEFGGIGEYTKYVKRTEEIMDELKNPNLTDEVRGNLTKELRIREENIRKRNKLASEIYPLEPEDFISKYGDDISKNPLGIKDKEWRNDNQITDLRNNGILDDIAQRIETNPSENFVQSPTKIAQADEQELTKQKWQLAQRMNDNKSIKYFNTILENNAKQIEEYKKGIGELKLSSIFGDEGALKEIDDLNKEIDKLNYFNEMTKQKKTKLINDYKNIGQRIIDEGNADLTIQSMIEEMGGLGESREIVPKKKPQFVNLGDSKEAKFARSIANQHNILEPIKMPTVVPELVKHNKQQIQKLVQLRVMQTFDKSGQSKAMNDALDMLIKSHMSNMKEYMPNDYKKLVEGVNNYKRNLRKAYMDYNTSKPIELGNGLVLNRKSNPLDKIGDKFFTKRGDGIARHGDNMGDELNRLAEEFINEGLPQPKMDDMQDIFDVNQYISNETRPLVDKQNTNVNALDSFRTPLDKSFKQKQEKIDGRTLNKRYTQTKDGYVPNTILDDVIENINNTPDHNQMGMIDYVDNNRIGVDVSSLKRPFKENAHIDDMDKLADIDRRLKERITPEMIENVVNSKSSIFDDVFGREATEQVAKEVKELASEGIDATKQPPKEKPKNMPTNLYKRWLNTWKKGVTIYNPGWHIQNFFQNKGQNYLALGADALMPQTQAKQLLKAINGEPNKAKGIVSGNLKKGNLKAYDVDELSKMAQELGVIDSLGEDVVNSKGIFGKLENQIDNSSIMQKLGNNEKHARLNHWLRQMENGMTPQEAVESVNKYLFDYGKSDSKVDKVMKNVDPFWTFHKNNTRLMTQSAFQHSGKLANIKRATDELSKGVPDDQKQSEESMYRDAQLPHASYKDSVNGAQYNYLFDQGMFPQIQDALPLKEEDSYFENKLNPLIRLAMQTIEGEGNFGNKVVDKDKAGWGEITKEDRYKEIARDLNPILPTLVNALHNNNERKEKLKDEKVSKETVDKQIFHEWVKYITGHKGNWYRNQK